MSVNDWFSYQDRRLGLEKAKPKYELVFPKSEPPIDHCRMEVVKNTPSDTFIGRIRQGIRDRLK